MGLLMKKTWIGLAIGMSMACLLWTGSRSTFADESMRVKIPPGLAWQDHHFAMTNWFYKYQWGDPAAQIRILSETGYDSVMLSLKDDPKRWEKLPAYLESMKDHDVRLAAIHARFYIEDGTYPQVIKDNLPLLKGTSVVLIPSVGSREKLGRRDPRATKMAVKILREMSDDAARHELGGIAPYMHIGNWIETVDDNLRIARLVDRRNVGVMFHLHHWQAIGNRGYDRLRSDLLRARPYLMTVVIQGTNESEATHRIVGEGDFNMVPLVRTLREMGYQGSLGTMGFTQQGDIPAKLARANRAWSGIKQHVLNP